METKHKKPYISWIWDDSLNTWVAPLEQPDLEWLYVWDEDSISWKNTGFKVSPHRKEQISSK